jgi:hypothetical protein
MRGRGWYNKSIGPSVGGQMTTKTRVDRSKFEEIAGELGVRVEVQAAFLKLHGPPGRQVYVARAQMCSRVDLSGFTVNDEGVRTLDILERFGQVHQQLRFEGRSEAQVLAAFRTVLEVMLALGPAEAVRRVGPVPGRAPLKGGARARLDRMAKTLRLDAIRRFARMANADRRIARSNQLLRDLGTEFDADGLPIVELPPLPSFVLEDEEDLGFTEDDPNDDVFADEEVFLVTAIQLAAEDAARAEAGTGGQAPDDVTA